MATKFSPCKGSYVLNQFPSYVMFGMNGFQVSASGAIQGHHGPLVQLFIEVNLLSTRKDAPDGLITLKSCAPYFEIFRQWHLDIILNAL